MSNNADLGLTDITPIADGHLCDLSQALLLHGCVLDTVPIVEGTDSLDSKIYRRQRERAGTLGVNNHGRLSPGYGLHLLQDHPW